MRRRFAGTRFAHAWDESERRNIPVPEDFVILVADRNRHVLDLLKRELSMDGYGIQMAKDDREVLENLGRETPPDLLVLDLEIPYGGGLKLVEALKVKSPRLPIIIYTLFTEYIQHPSLRRVAGFVEKSENIDTLKLKIMEVLRKYYPARFLKTEIELQKSKSPSSDT
jgi:DNA-binding response OmpR family regulator